MTPSELIINANPVETRVALMEGGAVVELFVERKGEAGGTVAGNTTAAATSVRVNGNSATIYQDDTFALPGQAISIPSSAPLLVVACIMATI